MKYTIILNISLLALLNIVNYTCANTEGITSSSSVLSSNIYGYNKRHKASHDPMWTYTHGINGHNAVQPMIY